MGLFDFFKKKEQRYEIATCYGCNKKIYEGEKYGHDDEQGNLLLGGYYFCSRCIGNQDFGNDICMYSDGKQRYRLKIKR
jgi:hypothetical protein